MPVPTPEPNYYSTGRSRRAFLIGAGSALVIGAGGLGLWASGVLAGNDDPDTVADSGGTAPSFDPETASGAAAPDPQPDAGGDDADEADRPSFTSMAMVGDSITEGSTAALDEVLADRGFTSIDVRGRASRRIEIGDGTGSPASGIRTLFEMISEGLRPDSWVIALGTNDVGQYAEDSDYVRLIDAVVTMLPDDQPLVWVDVYRPEYLDESKRFNQLLRERLDDRGNAFVADWYSRASDAELDILRDDGLHPNARGNLVFADLVADALARVAH